MRFSPIIVHLPGLGNRDDLANEFIALASEKLRPDGYASRRGAIAAGQRAISPPTAAVTSWRATTPVAMAA